MGQPNIHYNSVTARWEFRGRGGALRFTLDDTQPAGVGKIYAAVGSNVAFDVGSYAVAVGSIPLTGVAAGDMVWGTPKATFPANIGIVGFYVSGANNVNVSAVNAAGIAGSYPAMGWDMFAIRRVT